MADATQSSVPDESHVIRGVRIHPLLLDHQRELWTMFTKAKCAFGHDHGTLSTTVQSQMARQFSADKQLYERHGSRSPCKSNKIGSQVALSTSLKNTKGEERA